MTSFPIQAIVKRNKAFAIQATLLSKNNANTKIPIARTQRCQEIS